MSGSPRSRPPDLPNFRHLGYLGGGGFADVFLYEQLRPSRQVAIKVLRNPATDVAAQQAFDAEADLMARVSAHPYIVSIYGADIAPDGRPFLVMEYYPRPHFGVQARQSALAVAEVLQVGVRLASAVETAHRAGILHRDIKPANVLVSQYGRPGLTDFGIAGANENDGAGESQGVSVPYAPREIVLEESPGNERSDVYSLAATIYTLLAGRAPFEVIGGDNSVHAHAQRVLNAALPPTGRADIPQSLELLLAQGLARDANQRPGSAAAFGRALQGVERELGHAPTEFEVAEEVVPEAFHAPSSDDDPDADDGTRAAKVQVVRQSEPVPPATVGDKTPPPPVFDAPASTSDDEGSSGPEEHSHTVARRGARARPAPMVPAEPDLPASEGSPRNSRRAPWAVVASAVVLLAVIGAVAALSGGGSDADSNSSSSTPVDDDALVIPDSPPVPADVRVEVTDGVATVSWQPGEGAEDGDTYLVTRTDVEPPTTTESDSPPLEVTVGGDSPPCFEISAQRGSRGSLDSSAEVCADDG